MSTGYIFRSYCLVIACFFYISSWSQGDCPVNLDFENGNLDGWRCRTGHVSISGEILWQGSSQIPDRHQLIPSDGNTDRDPYGNFPKICPNGSGYSIRLGNDITGAQADGISYSINIPATATNFSLIYYYAIVLQNPDHGPEEQPRFIARIIDESNGEQVNCVSFDFTSSASLPGFQMAPGTTQIMYKDWTPITVSLGAYAGKTVRVEFITQDCSRGGHFGYAYIDVNSSCDGTILGSTICEGETDYLLTAPFGFESYKWFLGTDFQTHISSLQVYALTPLPPAGTIYSVIVKPYPGFGCEDTLYATIRKFPKPPADAGPDKIICKGETVEVGAPPNPAYRYLWRPTTMVSNRFIANPTTQGNPSTPVELILRTTDPVSGCFLQDTTIITVKSVDTAMQVIGKTGFCTGDVINTGFSLNTINAVQWYNGNNPVPGATTTSFNPTTTGLYWAKVAYDGCADSTRKKAVTLGAYPTAGFSVDNNNRCTGIPMNFTDQSTIVSGEPMTYAWYFSDGSIAGTKDVLKTFITGGDKTIKLVVSTANNCKDSIEQTITILANSIPDFSWEPVCMNIPIVFKNLTDESGALQTTYHWDFNNGMQSNLKDPPSFSYTKGGEYTVKLEALSSACSLMPRTITKKVKIANAAPSVRYRDLLVGKNVPTYLEAKSNAGVVFEWQPQQSLNEYAVKRPLFQGATDVKYQVRITDNNNCISTDTLLVRIMDKIGTYLPSAFTPNGDGLNDDIKPLLVGMKNLKRFAIYNRSGNCVFSTSIENTGWDGKYKGVMQENGVYVWIIEYINQQDKTIVEKGTITLIR